MFAVGLSYMAFIMLRYIPSMPDIWRVFIINGCLIFSKALSVSIEIIVWFLSFNLLMWCITVIDLQHSAFFMVQLSYPYMTTGTTIALTGRTFVGKVTSLLFNMLSRLVIAFLPRSQCLLISWLQSPSVVILEPPKIKPLTVSIVSPSICHELLGPDATILVFWMLSFSQLFHSLLSLSSRSSLVLLWFLP